MCKKRTLYISYDGMTDPLGSSQVIPYLAGLSALGHGITVLSCEKPDRFAKSGERVRARLRENGIDWYPVSYHKFPPVLSTLYDLWQLFRAAGRLVRQGEWKSVHCRSYIPSLVGLWLKKRQGLSFLFDMRGFWADERVDGKLWNLGNPVYRVIYRFFKSREQDFLREADAVVSLTYSGREEMQGWPVKPGQVDVIPCCVDLERFRRESLDPAAVETARERLALKPGERLAVYLGSIGTWYLLDEMLVLFARIQGENPSFRFLFLTPDDPEWIFRRAGENGVSRESLIVLSVRHEEVPSFLALADLGIFFIRPVYSKKSSSPTKLGELLAMGIPVIANKGVGDIDYIFEKYPVGHLLGSFSGEEMGKAVRELPKVTALSRAGIRKAAEEYFSLEQGILRYREIYERIGRLHGG